MVGEVLLTFVELAWSRNSVPADSPSRSCPSRSSVPSAGAKISSRGQQQAEKNSASAEMTEWWSVNVLGTSARNWPQENSS